MKRTLLVIGACLLTAGCASDKVTFDEAVYNDAMPYFYIDDATEADYIDVICQSEHNFVNRETQIAGFASYSGVTDPETVNNYIDIVIDYHCGA